MSELKRWVQDGRVAPEDALSPNQSEWQPAPEIAALEMNCLIRFRSGEEYGPLHRRAIIDLILDGDIAPDEPVYDAASKQTSSAAVIGLRALLDQPAAAPPAADVNLQLETERQRHRQREAALQERLERIESELAAQTEELALVREEAIVARQAEEAQQTDESAGNPVLRAALSRVKGSARARKGMGQAHVTQAERNAILRRSRAVPAPPRKDKRSKR